MNAADLYAKTLEGYSSLLPEHRVSLMSYCKEHRVNYHGFRYWMKQNSIPSPVSVSKHAQVVSSGSFVPVSILPAESPCANTSSRPSSGLLKGVRISLKDGVQVSIETLIVSDMIEILHSFTHRPNLCLR